MSKVNHNKSRELTNGLWCTNAPAGVQLIKPIVVATTATIEEHFTLTREYVKVPFILSK